ncbi:MAG: sigma-70 family RNA polymerase sigma factor [Planctomycetota bacterium]
MTQSLEELFARFQATADPRAIAAVYDRVAPDLLLLAVHLGVRDGDAEDLLQATFVAAIQSASSYQNGRPLLPWLMGILGNQAKHLWRDRRRKPDADRAPGPSPSGPDPLEAAAQSEFAEEFARKLRALPAGYRDTLTLRFVHGLTPTQIAHSLGVPVDTVKTRLKRGTELLRRALPAGFAALVIAQLAPARDLASVRRAVLAAAEAARAARTPTLFGIGLGKAMGALVLIAVAIPMWTWWSGRDAPKQDGRASTAPTGQTPAAREEHGSGAARTAQDDLRTDALRDAVRVQFADGSPAADVRVDVVRADVSDPLLHERRLVTGPDGVLDLEPDPEHTLLLQVDRGGGAAWRPGDPAPRIRIPRGVDVEIHVGAGGQPRAGASVLLSRDGRPDEVRECGVTRPDGKLLLRSVEPGRTVSALVAGCTPAPLVAIEGAIGTLQRVVVDLDSLRSRWTLSGRVLDADGAPQPFAHVQVGTRLPFLDLRNAAAGAESRTPPVDVVCDADGRFERAGFITEGGVIKVWARAPGHPPLAASIGYEAARPVRDVELRLPRGRRMQGRILDRSNAPVPDAEITAVPCDDREANRAPRFAISRVRTDGDGRFALDGLPLAALTAVAVTADGRRARHAFESEGDLEWQAWVSESTVISGSLLDPRGAPIAGLMVRGLVDTGRTEPTAATTDARGVFSLLDCDDGEHTLWVIDPRSPWNGRVAALPRVRAEQTPSQLVVPDRLRSTTSIRGRLLDESGRPVAGDVRLGNLRVGECFASAAADGTFAIGPLPALEQWDLAFRDGHGLWGFRGRIATEVERTTDLGDIEMRPCGRIRARLDLGGCSAAGRVVMKVTTMDHALVDEIELHEGVGRTGPLPRGDYLVAFVGEGIAMQGHVVAVQAGVETPFDCAAGEGVPFLLRIDHEDDGWDLRVWAEWRRADGERIGEERLQFARGRPFEVRRCLPSGGYRLRVTTHSGRSAETGFDLLGTERGSELVVRPR